MTAFGRAGCDLVEWEIRSVNHRYLELGFRLPDPCQGLEQSLRELTISRIRRGKVDATLRLAPRAAVASRLHDGNLETLLAVVANLGTRTAVGPVDPLALLRWPGVLEDDPERVARIRQTALARYAVAVDALVAHRDSEGAGLDALLRERLAAVERIGGAVRHLVAQHAEVLRERLRSRIHALASRFDESRLEQEVALLVQKADVAEELERLEIHVAQIRASLDGSEPCGRRLDFLIQELGREANTLAAKSGLPEAARLAVDLKVAIDQMREQAQNVE